MALLGHATPAPPAETEPQNEGTIDRETGFSTPLSNRKPGEATEDSLDSNNNKRDAASVLESDKSPFSLEHRRKRLGIIWWKWELLCWILSFALLCGIVATLFAFQNHPIPNWPYGITVNTIVAILVTLEALLLEIPISIAIAQVRWNWFRDKRPLIDFVKIGEASQGPLGSLKLLLRRRGGIPSLCGAFLMIWILAIPPLVQQVISYQNLRIQQGEATLSTVLNWPGMNHEHFPSTEFQKTLYKALGASHDLEPNPRRLCSTGNCTWPTATSLAVCSSCRDITKFLTSNGYLSDTFGLNTIPLLRYPVRPTGTPTGTPEPRKPENLLNGPNEPLPLLEVSVPRGGLLLPVCPVDPLMNMQAYSDVKIPNLQNEKIIWQGAVISKALGIPKLVAETCALYFCVATFETSEISGHVEERRVDSFDRGQPVKVNSHFGHVEFIAPKTAEKFEFSGRGREALKSYLELSMTGFVNNCTSTNIHSWGPRQSAKHLKSALEADNDYLGISKNMYEHMRRPGNGTLTPIFENAARAITDFLRDPSLNLKQNGEQPKFRNITGKAVRTVPVVHIRWGWIALPATVQLLALCFILSVVWYTAKEDLVPWRQGAIESLFYGPEESIRKDAGRIASSAKLEQFTESLIVRLEKVDGGWRLVRAGDLP